MYLLTDQSVIKITAHVALTWLPSVSSSANDLDSFPLVNLTQARAEG